jgi:hypothetical protein
VKPLAVLSVAVGSIVLFMAGFVWWPGVGEEWPGIIAFVVGTAGGGLILLGVRLWRRPSDDGQKTSRSSYDG